jgi:hypothetical protein
MHDGVEWRRNIAACGYRPESDFSLLLFVPLLRILSTLDVCQKTNMQPFTSALTPGIP